MEDRFGKYAIRNAKPAFACMYTYIGRYIHVSRIESVCSGSFILDRASDYKMAIYIYTYASLTCDGDSVNTSKITAFGVHI